MKHNFEVKIYHADTDCYGIVWHGSYLRLFEQARCEFVSLASKSMKYFEEKGILFPLIEINVKYKQPAKIHDVLNIETSIEKLTPLRATMLQKITNKLNGQEICEALITFVCTDLNGNLYRKIPQELFEMLKSLKD